MKEKQTMNNRLNRLGLAVVPALAYGLCSLLFASCRIDRFGYEYWRQCSAGGPFIIAFWHFSIFLMGYQAEGRKMVAMVSGSSDGEFLARLLHKIGHETVRGSRRKGGLDALKEMSAWLAKGYSGVIVADGSQGPARQVQAGVILLASRTGAPILPMTWAADRYFAFNSWDRSILPKPFARIALGYGEPLAVPAGIKSQELQRYRLDLEERLNRLYEEAWGRFDKKEH